MCESAELLKVNDELQLNGVIEYAVPVGIVVCALCRVNGVLQWCCLVTLMQCRI